MKFSGKLAIFNSILILLIPALPNVYASDKIRLVPDDPRGIVGESLQMWCSISSTSGVNSSDLELCFQLVTSTELPIPVNSRFIQIVNETTVEMNYLDLNMSFNNAWVICGLSCSRVDQKKTTETKLYDLQLLRVGYRPFKPYIVKDYKVYNWDHFTFSWDINEIDPVYLTKYEAWFKRREKLEFTSCSDGKGAKQQGNTCRIAKALDLVHPHGELEFKVNGSNVVGQITSDIEKVDLHHIIQPGKVTNVTVESTVSNGVVAEFYPPTKEHPLKYRISVACGNTTWPIIVVKNLTRRISKGPIRWKIEHVLPPYTKCHLTVSCLPFYNRQYWSDWSKNVSFTTPDGFPLVGPQLCCFETEPRNLKERGIKIYYKNLNERQAQGEVVQYHVQFNILTSGSQMNVTYAKEKYEDPGKPFLSLDVETNKSYTVSISAQTRAGRNTSAVSLMPVLSQDEILPLPQNMTAIWYGSRTVNVSWLPLEAKLFDYTVIWCKGSSQCQKPVDWEITSSSSYEIQLPPDETHLSYRFGIVVSRVGGGSSGIKWLKCTYNISAGASAPNVHVVNKTSSAVSLHFDEPVCGGGNSGYIYQYLIYYSLTDEVVSFFRNPHQLKIAEWNVVIDQLEPDSNYSFHAVALTYNGPSEEKVISIRTDRSGKLMSWQLALISIGAVLGFFFIVFGIYSCCRGSADGGGCLSSSYTSLTKNQEPLLLDSDTLHSEQVKNCSDVKDEKEGILTVARGTFPVVQDMRPVTEGDSTPLPPTAKHSSGPDERLLAISEDSCNKNSIPKDTKSDVLQNLEPNLSLIQQPKHILSSNNYEVSSSSMPSAPAVKYSSSSISLARKHRIGSTIGHSPGDATGCVNDNTTCCGIDHATGSAEESNLMNRTLLASTADTQSEQTDEAALISQNSLHTLDAGNLGNVAISVSNHHVDESDEVEDYSNVRMTDPLEHIESSADTYEDGYSLARPPDADDEITEEESDNDYSNATLFDDVDNQLDATAAQPVLQSLMDNSNHNESAEDEEDEQDSYNYSRASIIRRLP